MVSEEIKAMQEAYWARPFAVQWRDSHFSTTDKFLTLEGAFDFIEYHWARIRKDVATRRNVESLLRQCYLETPEGRVSLRYVLLCDDVSSY
jgi:hypothetical protein